MNTSNHNLTLTAYRVVSKTASGRLLGQRKCERVVTIVLAERNNAKTPEAYRTQARAAVRKKVGFVWWLPLALWLAEIVIKIVIQRYWDKRNA